MPWRSRLAGDQGQRGIAGFHLVPKLQLGNTTVQKLQLRFEAVPKPAIRVNGVLPVLRVAGKPAPTDNGTPGRSLDGTPRRSP